VIGRPPAPDRLVTSTISLSPGKKRELFAIKDDAGISVREWAEAHIERDYLRVTRVEKERAADAQSHTPRRPIPAPAKATKSAEDDGVIKYGLRITEDKKDKLRRIKFLEGVTTQQWAEDHIERDYRAMLDRIAEHNADKRLAADRRKTAGRR
jgi:hypothetical protein